MKKILIIEDDDHLRESTAEFIGEEGFEVITARNGLLGIQKTIEHLPDLIICDITMPKMDGYDVYKILKENYSTSLIPFIFLTAKVEKEDLRLGMQIGADDYITKPFDYRDLIISIKTRLEKNEKLLNAGEDKYKSILENTLVGVFMLKDNIINYCNHKFAKLMDTKKESLEHKNIIDFVHPDEKQHVEDQLHKCQKGLKTSIHIDFRLLSPENKIKVVDLYAGHTKDKGSATISGIMVEKKNQNIADEDGYNIKFSKNRDLERFLKIISKDTSYFSNDFIDRLTEEYNLEKFAKSKNQQNPDNLTKREIEVLQHISEGLSNKEISNLLFISQRTVDGHRTNLLSKTGVKNTAELIVYGIKHELIKVS